MLDTLKLSLRDFVIGPDAPLEVQPPAVNAATGELGPEHLLWWTPGRKVTGARAWHNSERINISVKPRVEKSELSGVCLVQFSVPKVAGGSNYHGTDHAGTVAALDAVQRHLDDLDIKTNVRSAAVSRLDAAQSLSMREPFESYSQVLGRLTAKRAGRRDYGTTYLFGNTRWEACFYDKLEEMRRQKVSTDGLPANSLRAELRALEGSKVREMFGFQSAGELVADLGHVRAVYRAHMEKQLLREVAPGDPGVAVSGLVEQFQAAQEAGPRWWSAWKEAELMRHLAPDAEAVKHAIRLAAPSRREANRIIREVEQREREALALRRLGPSSRTWGELYDELREKVLA